MGTVDNVNIVDEILILISTYSQSVCQKCIISYVLKNIPGKCSQYKWSTKITSFIGLSLVESSLYPIWLQTKKTQL